MRNRARVLRKDVNVGILSRNDADDNDDDANVDAAAAATASLDYNVLRIL